MLDLGLAGAKDIRVNITRTGFVELIIKEEVRVALTNVAVDCIVDAKEAGF